MWLGSFVSSAGVLQELPRGFGAYNNLRILDLSSNRLTELTSQIGLLGSLHELLCSFNFIEVIPPEIGRLKNLTIFSIASNKLTQLPVEMSGLVSLKSLDVCKNLLQVLPPELGILKELRKLDIAANPWIEELKTPAKKGPDFLLNYLRSEEYDAVYFRWMQEQAKKKDRE